MKYYLIGILFVLIACNGQKKASVENSVGQLKSDTPLEFILQDEYGSFEVEETMVIKDEKRLKSFYAKINKTRKPGLSVPDIDFSKEMVIVHCSGAQNQSGIPILTYHKETTTQVLLEHKIEKGTTAVKTNPFCVYKLPLTEKEIVVEKGIP